MMRVALTGSIATGKSEAARLFSLLGVPVFDSDDVVHELYSAGGEAVAPIGKVVPDAITRGFVDRGRLMDAIRSDAAILTRIESIVHGMVHAAEERFSRAAESAGAPFVIVDAPLLFETGRNRSFDRVIVVSCPPRIQRERALRRPGMTPEKLELLLRRQMPDDRKRLMADYILDNSGTLDDLADEVRRLVGELAAAGGNGGLPHA